MNDESTMTGPLKNSVWISGPVWDSVFIFGNLFLMIAALLYQHFVPFSALQQIAIASVITLLFSGGHLLAPFLLLLFSPHERRRARLTQPKLTRHLAIILALPVLFYGFAAFTFATQFQNKSLQVLDVLRPLAIVGAVWFTWNSWHFAKQQFGILQIYRAKSNAVSKSWRRFDFWFTLAFVGIFPASILLDHDQPIPFVSILLGRKLSLEPLINVMAVAIVIVGLATFTQLARQKNKSLPLFLTYATLFVQAIAVWTVPGFFHKLAFVTAHWIQEIFLVSLIFANTVNGTDSTKNAKNAKVLETGIEKTEPHRSYGAMAFFLLCLVALLAISFGYSQFVKLPALSKFWIGTTGGMSGLGIITPDIFWIVAAVFSVLMFFNIGHMYLDRVIYKKRSW